MLYVDNQRLGQFRCDMGGYDYELVPLVPIVRRPACVERSVKVRQNPLGYRCEVEINSMYEHPRLVDHRVGDSDYRLL